MRGEDLAPLRVRTRDVARQSRHIIDRLLQGSKADITAIRVVPRLFTVILSDFIVNFIL